MVRSLRQNGRSVGITGHRRRLAATALAVLAVAAAVGPTTLVATAGAATNHGHRIISAHDRPLKSGEYRINSDLTLDLGTGVSGSVNGESEKCVNSNGGFGYTTGSDQETHDYWIDVSESVIPPCFSSKSYSYFTVHVNSPYKGQVGLLLAEESDGKPGRSDYHLTCTTGLAVHLACKQTGPLAATVTCVDSPYQGACVDTSSSPHIQCTGHVELHVGQHLDHEHVCTATGNPLPTVTLSGDPLPDGLTYRRWPTNTDTWIVLDGTVTRADLRTTSTAFIAGPRVAATVDFSVRS